MRRVLIEPSRRVFANIEDLGPGQWFFPDIPPSQMGQLWSTIGLDSEIGEKLQRFAQIDPQTGFTVVRPPASLVRNLKPEVRLRLHKLLSTCEANVAQRHPFSFRGKRFSDWFVSSGLSSEVVGIVRPFVFRQGNRLMFTDLELVWPLIQDPEERLRLLRALRRESSFVLHLQLPRSVDMDALTTYWGGHGRDEHVDTVLHSFQKSVGEIDVLYLLPVFARSRLYTYPAVPRPGERRPDCHWTAFNFLRDRPDERFFDYEYTLRYAREQCERVVGPPALGDIYCMLTDEGKMIHSCVHVAGNIVFTKNGIGHRMPYLLETLEAVVDHYEAQGATRVLLIRPPA